MRTNDLINQVHDLEDQVACKDRLIEMLTNERNALAAVLREAIAPGGIGPHEFSRPGGWRERAERVMKGLS